MSDLDTIDNLQIADLSAETLDALRSIREMQAAGANFQVYKLTLSRLIKIIDYYLPASENGVLDEHLMRARRSGKNLSSTVKAISEMNKMLGHYAPQAFFSASSNESQTLSKLDRVAMIYASE